MNYRRRAASVTKQSPPLLRRKVRLRVSFFLAALLSAAAGFLDPSLAGEETVPPPTPPLGPGKPADPEAGTLEESKPKTPGETADPAGGPESIRQDLSTVRLMPALGEVAPGEPAVFVLRGPEEFLNGAVGRYALRDEYGREVCRGSLKIAQLKLEEEGTRRFSIPTLRALAADHTLMLALVSADDRRVEREAVFRISRRVAWESWMAFVHAPYAGKAGGGLVKLGIRGGMAYRMNASRLAALKMTGTPFFVENIARQFLSRYQAERGLWEKTLASIAQDTDTHAALSRAPSFCSKEFAEAYAKELQRFAEFYHPEAPLFYSLAAEPSVTRLAAACDFDFHREALEEFRRWLEREIYGTLPALNSAWGTEFTKWSDVVPMTTPEARLRLKHGVLNFAPWVDFRSFQDHLFAKILREGAGVIRRTDSQARIGITGALGAFAFGGWDWSRLAGALDVVEAYDIGGARALWRDLAPGKPALGLVSLADDPASLQEARRSLWNLALEGGPRGALLWDEAPPGLGGEAKGGRLLLDTEGKPTNLARVLAPTLQELDGPLGLLLARAKRLRGNVALLYSPASVRLNWLFEASHLHGDGCLKAWGADTTAERRESFQLKLRESWSKLLSDLGLAWRFVSSAEVEAGVLLDQGAGFKAVVLPRVLALSEREAGALKAFVHEGGTLVADALCGRFDEHGQGRKKPLLDDLFGLDTSQEPWVPESERLLDRILDVSTGERGPLLPAQLYAALPPVFSDKPVWRGEAPAQRGEFRKSPVLVRRSVGKGTAVYLNLALDDYLRWRLHPGRPRAAATREALTRLAFGPLREALPVDLSASTLPCGAEMIWMVLGEGPSALRLLALRRNVQDRLHELGQAEDDNQALEKAEPFKLVLREKTWISHLRADLPPTQTLVLEGALDPVSPALFALRSRASPTPAAIAPAAVKAGDLLALQILPGPGAGEGPRIYGIRVWAPDRREHAFYGGRWLAPDGKLTVSIPLAFNDPAGDWTLAIKDITTGLETSLAVKVQVAE